MSALDFLLNCAALLLWLSWRSRTLDQPVRASGVALISTLKRASVSSRESWSSLAVLAALLFLRAILYCQLGPAAHWMPGLSLGAVVLHFRSDLFGRMLLFSLLGFLLWLAAFYFSLLLLAVVNRGGANDSWQSFARAHLGLVARWPDGLKLLLPFVVMFVFWLAGGPLLGVLQVQAPAVSARHLVEQAFIIGLGGWLLWQYLLVAVLGLHLVSSYIYFGRAPFWNFVNSTARHLLRPVAALPLRVGKIDFIPVLALAVAVLAAVLAPRLLAALYVKLPF